jgi:hypothetical protein
MTTTEYRYALTSVHDLLDDEPKAPTSRRGSAYTRHTAWTHDLQRALANALSLLDAGGDDGLLVQLVEDLFEGVPVHVFSALDGNNALIESIGFKLNGAEWHWKLRRVRNRSSRLFSVLARSSGGA